MTVILLCPVLMKSCICPPILGRGIPALWFFLRFLLEVSSFLPVLGLLRVFPHQVQGSRDCCYVQMVKPSQVTFHLWYWATQIKLDWLIDWLTLCFQQCSWQVICYGLFYVILSGRLRYKSFPCLGSREVSISRVFTFIKKEAWSITSPN